MPTKTTAPGLTENALKAHIVRAQRVKWERSLLTKDQRARVDAEIAAINGAGKPRKK